MLLRNLTVAVCTSLVIVVCVPQFSIAQTGAFPAFSPETADEQVEESAPTSGRFPSAEPATQPQSSSGSASRFPSQQTQFPTETTNFPTPSLSDKQIQAVGFPRAQDETTELTIEQLSVMLESVGLEPKRFNDRLDLMYRADLDSQELELFFSVFFSHSTQQLRICAWLDPLPKTIGSEQPLLELLERNTQLTNGMRYGFSQRTQRFLLETGLNSEGLQPELLSKALDQVAQEVATSWELWATSQWNEPPKRVARQQEFDSRVYDRANQQFEMPVRR